MKNKFFSLTLLITTIALGLSFGSCKKVPGPKGDPGPQGNANVTGTNVITIKNWELDGELWFGSAPLSGITQTILDRGVVSVFMQYDNEWWALPDINGINSTQFGFGLGTINLMNSNSDGSTPPNPGPTNIRVVIVSPANKAANPDVDWKDYKQVEKALSNSTN